jgi:hypothetical protein
MFPKRHSERCDHFGTKFYKEKTGLTALPAGVPVSRRQFRLQPESRHLRDQQALLQRQGGQHRPGPNVIKLFTAVIYKFSLISYSVCPWQAFPA